MLKIFKIFMVVWLSSQFCYESRILSKSQLDSERPPDSQSQIDAKIRSNSENTPLASSLPQITKVSLDTEIQQKSAILEKILKSRVNPEGKSNASELRETRSELLESKGLDELSEITPSDLQVKRHSYHGRSSLPMRLESQSSPRHNQLEVDTAKGKSLIFKESTPYLPMTPVDRREDAHKGRQFIDPRYKQSIVYGYKFKVADTVYLLVYVFFFMFVIEISMVIVFFFKQNRNYIANHMTLNFFCMLGQTINNIVYYSKKSDFEIEEWSFWFEMFIILLFVLQILIGNMLNKRLLNPKLVKRIFILRLIHRLCGYTIYLGTKGHIFYINYSMFYHEYQTVFYILSTMGVLFYVMFYLTFFFCLLDVRHYEFNGPFLVDTSKQGKVLKEMLINIENGDFEQPNKADNFRMNLGNFRGSGGCPFSQGKLGLNSIDNEFFGMGKKMNLKILSSKDEEDIETGQIQIDEHNVNPVIPWFMLEDKIFDLRNLRHPKGLYILYGLSYQDITREIHGLKAMRFENKDESFFKYLKHCHVNRTFHLIKDHCIGFIDTNKHLIVRNKSKKLLQKVKQEIKLQKANAHENRDQLQQDLVAAGDGRKSYRSQSSYGSGSSSSVMGFSPNIMNFLDKHSLKNKYSKNWEVHSKMNFGKKATVYWIWTRDHDYLLNMKNYWIRNFGKYFFLKKGDLKQYHYICMAAHPKYLVRKYLTLAMSSQSMLNWLFLRMPPSVQNLTRCYLGFNLMGMGEEYSTRFLSHDDFDDDPDSTDSLSMLRRLLRPDQPLELVPPAEVNLLKGNFVKNSQVKHEIPDEIASLDTPLSQFIPLIQTPINKVPQSRNILDLKTNFELKSGLGLGLSISNFSNKKILFAVRDTGIIPVLDFMEVLLQVRILQLKSLISDHQRRAGNDQIYLDEQNRINARMDFVRRKVDQFKAEAKVPGEESDFTYESIRPFDAEYLLTFSNRPEFRIYWELNLFTNDAQQSLYEYLGLQILKELEVVDRMVVELSDAVDDFDSIPPGIQELNESQEIATDLNDEYTESELEPKESQERVALEEEHFESMYAPQLLKKFVINTPNKLKKQFQWEGDLVQVINRDVGNLEQVLETVEMKDIQRLILSGSDQFCSKILKKSPMPLSYVTVL